MCIRDSRKIIDAIPYVATARMNVEDSRRLNILFKINNDLERMGDHVLNLSEHASQILKEKQKITPEAHQELADLRTILDQTAALLPAIEEYHQPATLQHIDQLEEQLDKCLSLLHISVGVMENAELHPAGSLS